MYQNSQLSSSHCAHVGTHISMWWMVILCDYLGGGWRCSLDVARVFHDLFFGSATKDG